jgi:signal transduction histidine kinase
VAARPTAGQELLLTTEIAPLDDSMPMRIAVRDAPTDTVTVTVYAGESLTDARATISELVVLLAVGVPLLALLVAVATWWAVGRTLRPVREITRTMSEITTSDLHRRVPEPDALDEIGELASTVNDTLERLDGSVETQRRFVADASHELRGPLAALRADIEISVTHPDQTEWLDVARATLGDVERLEQLTDDLLLLARLDAQQPMRAAIVDLAALAKEAIGAIRRSDVTVTTTGLDVPATVRGDPSQLRRMIRNLVHNAEQHARSNIDVGLTGLDAMVRLVVGDDGPGIPFEDRKRVLQRFVRLDTARSRNAGGTGLGLAIVAEVVSSHEGILTIEEGALGGAELVVDLPRAN